MSIINHNYNILEQTISDLPSGLIDESDIENYCIHLHILAQYLINTPNCLILPSEINDGKIFRSDKKDILKLENDFLPRPVDNKTYPIWFTTEYPGLSYLNETKSDQWIIACRKVKNEKIKDGIIIGYNFYVNFDGELDKDILCKEQGGIIVKRLNKDLMKLIDNILQLFYKNNKSDDPRKIVIPNYNDTQKYLVSLDELFSTYSYKNGTRNSVYELDRYIANTMMIIFDNVQEILRKQPDNIFVTGINNNITILGYYEGNIRLDPTLYPDDCNSINSEVTIQSQYLDKKVVNDYFYPRDKFNVDCKTELIKFSSKKRTVIGGKNNKTKKLRHRVYKNKQKSKIRSIKPKQNNIYSISMTWFTEDISFNKIFGNWHDRQRYYEREGRQKFLKICHEKKLVEMRIFIQENKDNAGKIEEGYDTYKYDIDDYKKILQEEGVI